MNNLSVLDEILEVLVEIAENAKDVYIKSAAQANIIKYKKQIEDEKKKNALDVIEYKISKLVNKLK